MLTQPDTQIEEAGAFIDSLRKCPKSGLHNPFRNKERYLMLGEVCRKLVESMQDKQVWNFFIDSIQRTCPKSVQQTTGELKVTIDFFKNFCGDNVRYLASADRSPGDHLGQFATGYRWPYGPVAVITPFNFPLEIPVLQMMGGLFMGNKVLVKPDVKTGMPLEQFIRLLHHCGLPKEDLDLLYADGPVVEHILKKAPVNQTLFTGSSNVGEHLAKVLRGKIRLEDAGFDWKILGPDVPKDQREIDYIAWQSDQDAYAHSGQKCSAQSILFMHKNWSKTNFLEIIERQASKRNLQNMSVGPILSWNNERIKEHIDSVLELDGAKLLFGGEPLPQPHRIPAQYGSYKPTAIYVPLKHFRSERKLKLLTTELFGPFQIITDYKTKEVSFLLEILESMSHHLTAAVVSNDNVFTEQILGSTVNGTTYSGLRARTTGAPQNHWFGPAGDPRGAGIGTAEAIKLVWSHHREIVTDIGPMAESWTIPEPN